MAPQLVEAEYLDIEGEYAYASMTIEVKGFDPEANDVVMTFVIQDYAQTITTTYGDLSLVEATAAH